MEEYIGVAKKTINEIDYFYEIPQEYLTQTWFIQFAKIGDALFILPDWKLIKESNGIFKFDKLVKIRLRELHNEKAAIEKPIEYPESYDEDEPPSPQVEYGTTTIVKDLNPEFTFQVVITPKNWGKIKTLMVLDHWETVKIPEIYNEEKWKEILQGVGIWENLSEESKKKLTTTTNVELQNLIWRIVSTNDNSYDPFFVQALFHLPEPKTEQKPVYVRKETTQLKDVDIDIIVYGEKIELKYHIDNGGMVNKCGENGEILDRFVVYSFKVPYLDLICDWLGVEKPEEKNKKILRRGERW